MQLRARREILLSAEMEVETLCGLTYNCHNLMYKGLSARRQTLQHLCCDDRKVFFSEAIYAELLLEFMHDEDLPDPRHGPHRPQGARRPAALRERRGSLSQGTFAK